MWINNRSESVWMNCSLKLRMNHFSFKELQFYQQLFGMCINLMWTISDVSGCG